jgi:hypothetical protein
MAMSDFGICKNGDALFECLAMHLPVLASDTLSGDDAYRTLYLDSFGTELNRYVEGELVPELVGMNFPEKVAELWAEWVIDPRLKFAVVDWAYEVLPKFLPHIMGDMFTENRIDYVAVRKPDDVLIEGIMKMVDGYQSIKEMSRQGDISAKSGQVRMGILNS